MATSVHHIIYGSNESLIVQLYDVTTDTGSNGIDLTGISAIVVTAKNPETGTVDTLTGVVLGTPTDGKFQIDHLVTELNEVGAWDLQIKYTDAIGNIRKYPSEGNQLKIAVSESN